MADVKFGGRIDRKMYVDAQRLYMRPGWCRVVLIVLGALLMGYCVIGFLLVPGSRPSAGVIVGVPAFWALWLVFLWLILPIVNARRVERTSRIFGSPLHGVATEAGIHLESEFGTSSLPWGVFFRFKMTDPGRPLSVGADVQHLPAFVLRQRRGMADLPRMGDEESAGKAATVESDPRTTRTCSLGMTYCSDQR